MPEEQRPRAVFWNEDFKLIRTAIDPGSQPFANCRWPFEIVKARTAAPRHQGEIGAFLYHLIQNRGKACPDVHETRSKIGGLRGAQRS